MEHSGVAMWPSTCWAQASHLSDVSGFVYMQLKSTSGVSRQDAVECHLNTPTSVPDALAGSTDDILVSWGPMSMDENLPHCGHHTTNLPFCRTYVVL